MLVKQILKGEIFDAQSEGLPAFGNEPTNGRTYSWSQNKLASPEDEPAENYERISNQQGQFSS